MKAKPRARVPSAYALAVLFRSVGRDLARSLPLKETSAKELPDALRLTLVRTASELLGRAENSNRSESPFAPAVTVCTKGSELSREIGDNGHRRRQTNVRSREESMDAALGPGRGIGRDISRGPGEKAERQIDVFISHRHEARLESEGERASLEEEVWKESERHHIVQRRERNRQEWIEHYEAQAARLEATLGSLVDRCREEAERLRG